MKLRTKFFLISAFLAIVPLVSFTYYSYNHYTETTYERMDEFSENLFHNAVTTANNTLASISQTISFLTFYSNNDTDSIVNTLRMFSETESYTSYDVWNANQYCVSVFQNLMLSNTYIEGIYLFTPGNESFYSCNTQNGQLSPGYDPRKEDWYLKTIDLDGKYYINTTTSPDMFTKENDCLYFARSISDVYSHNFFGVILVACDADVLDLSNVNTMPELTMLSVTNEATDMVLYTNLNELDEAFSSSNKEVKSADLAITPLRLTAAFDYDSLFSEFNYTGTLLLTIASVCIVLIIVVSYFITTGFVRPLENLSRIMAQQNGRPFTFSSPYMNYTDEIGTLYNEYAHMLEELEASIKRDYKDKLIILDAQMKSLEARINSHFLFNTLESINSMAEIEDNEQIATMSLSLGNMFRYSIKTQSELVPLSDELKHVSDYVAIQKIRFSDRFSFVQDIPEELLEQKVLKLILQPLVENALYHGLNYCSRGDRITVQARAEQSTLYISVTDNGKGMNRETLRQLNERLQEEASFTELGHRTKQSIGLKNIHSRIELYYGKGYGLQIASREKEGTTITIRLPIVS